MIRNTEKFTLLIFLMFFYAFNMATSNAQLVSHYGSSDYDGKEIEIPNTHPMSNTESTEKNLVLRGSAPLKYMEELVRMDIDHVLIFKHETRTEVTDEIFQIHLLNQDFGTKIRYTHIPFKWKMKNDHWQEQDFYRACTQAIQGINLIKQQVRKNKKIFFHCTMGEDRTGFLAGLWKIHQHKADIQEVFKNEMCKNGYADGNTKKPESVSGSINYGLTPLFFKIATKIENLSPNRYISPEVCSNIDYFENLNEIRQTFSCDQI